MVILIPEHDESPAPVADSLPVTLLVLLHDGHPVHADSQADNGRHDVYWSQAALGEDVERYDDTDPLANVEEGVLDRVEDAEDHGEADDVVHGVTDGGDPEVLAQQVDVVSSSDENYQDSGKYQQKPNERNRSESL